MRIHILQHEAFVGPGNVLDWGRARGAVVQIVRLDLGEALPELKDFDGLVILGGTMSVNDEALFPWLRPEKQLVRAAIEAGKAVLGLCLGAQMMASACGARVQRAAQKEIGWWPVQATRGGGDALALPENFEVLHWHGETFELPKGAVLLARSEGCAHQAFQLGPRAIGLQFHPETTAESLAALMDNCGGVLTPGKFVQGEAALRASPSRCYTESRALMAQVLDYLTRPAAKA